MIFEGIQTMQKLICYKIYSWVGESEVKMPRERMNGWMDGWMWTSLSPQAKISFIIGHKGPSFIEWAHVEKYILKFLILANHVSML